VFFSFFPGLLSPTQKRLFQITLRLRLKIWLPYDYASGSTEGKWSGTYTHDTQTHLTGSERRRRRLPGRLVDIEAAHPHSAGSVSGHGDTMPRGKTLGEDHIMWHPGACHQKLQIICLRGVVVHQSGRLPTKFSRWFPRGNATAASQRPISNRQASQVRVKKKKREQKKKREKKETKKK
jgi:hypothetical protein